MTRRPPQVPKLVGSDIELGNFLLGTGRTDTADAACRLLVEEIDGIPADRGAALAPSAFVDPQDQGRKFLPTTAGSRYVDLSHAELATPECIGVSDHVAVRHAFLRIAQRAQAAVNARLPPGQRLVVMVNNSDGHHNSYGSHSSVLITRAAFENIFERRLHYLLFLASYQASSIVFTGAGKVGAENGAPAVDFALTQRGDFYESLVGWQTTHRRPIVNARDEALAGGTRGPYARLHSIFPDSVLCPGAMMLGTGVLQIVLAMIEAERIDSRLILDDPLAALHRWNHDPALRTRARTTTGRSLTAVELQLAFLEQARRFVEAGGCEGVVPEVHDVLALWGDTLERLRTGLDGLVGRLDWVTKLHALRRARARRPHLGWRSLEMKMLDDRYASLDPADGIFWAYERAGVIERAVSEERIRHFETEPPADTRAWTRAQLLRLAGPERVDAIDWDWIRFRPARGELVFPHVDLADPLGFTEAAMRDVFAGEPTLAAVLKALGARPASFDCAAPVVAVPYVH
jgi:proteasome accessory factor A